MKKLATLLVALFALCSASALAKPIDVYVTDSDQKFGHATVDATTTFKGDKIVVDRNKKFQTIDGFGAALTEAACVNLDRAGNSWLALFNPKDLNLNLCRLCIGSSDYAVSAYNYCDKVDPELKAFSIDRDRDVIIPVVKQALQANPALLLFASPWSPPGWMKSNGTMFGGNMQRKHMPAYALYFAKFIEAYRDAGVPIYAITVQNEVDTDQDGKMPQCTWPQEYEVDFVAQHLGPLFEKRGINSKIWIIDHNYNMWGRALASLEDAKLRKYVDAVAWHGYLGPPEKMTVVHDAYPTVGAHWTEGGPDITDPNYATNWTTWSKAFTDIMRNWSSSITAWNVALDAEGKPNIGPFPCGGLVTVEADKKLRYSGQYYALGHFSKFIQRGAKRIASEGTINGIKHVAFENPDGRIVVVLTNAGEQRDILVAMGDDVVNLAVSRNSVTTLAW